MNNRLKSFISYAHVDRDFVYEHILPILRNSSLEVWLDAEQLTPFSTILNTIVKGIREADVIICLLNKRSTFVNLELGVALGNNKPVIAILHEESINNLPSDFRYMNLIVYNNNSISEFKERLKSVITLVTDNVIDKGTFELEHEKGLHKIIGLRAGIAFENFEQELRFTSEFIDFIRALTNDAQIGLIQTAKGSLKSIISIDFKSWTELLEKLIFIVPELKRRKVERLKVEAEIEKIHAETKVINVDSNIKQAEAFVDLLAKYRRLGLKIQIDKDLLITQDQDGQLTFEKPKELRQ